MCLGDGVEPVQALTTNVIIRSKHGLPLNSAIRCVTGAGQMRSTSPPSRLPESVMASDLGFSSWGGLDSNQRPADHEQAAAHHAP